MSYSTPPETIKSARKKHSCDWCNEAIEKGSGYLRWRWYDEGDIGTGKAHAECYAVMQRVVSDDEVFYPHANPRGCDCGFEPGCKCGWEARELRAKINKALDTAIRRAEAKESQS